MCFRAPEGDQNSLLQKGQWYSVPLDQPDFAATNSFSTSSRVSKPRRCALAERSETLAFSSGIDPLDPQGEVSPGTVFLAQQCPGIAANGYRETRSIRAARRSGRTRWNVTQPSSSHKCFW